MSYEVTRTPEGRPQVIFAGQPLYVHALEAAPAAREKVLDTGRWLVLAFAAWSIPDIKAIQTGLDAAKAFSGTVQFGARPYEDVEEHGTWCPAISHDGPGPAWVFIDNGVVRLQRNGLMTTAQLIEAIKSVFPGA